jgi:uncharacterized protein (DUF58 family)
VKKEDGTVTPEPVTRWIPAVLVLLLILQLIVPSRVWIALLAILGGSLAGAYWWARELADHLSITREQHYGWVHVGDLLEEQLSMHNGTWVPAPWVEIDDGSDLPGYTARSVRSADPGQTLRWRTEGICRQRGLFTLGPWQARTGDPLGLFEVSFQHPETQSILVYPPIVHLPGLSLPRGAATGTGRTSRPTHEVTASAAGIRGYAPGDTWGRIHWRSTAHRDELMAKTFDLEPSGDLWIVLDLDAAVKAGAGEESTEEYAVILAASLANRVLDANRAVGMVAYGTWQPPGSAEPEPLPTLVLPQKGRAQQWRILEALAKVRAGGRWPLARVLAEMDRNLGRGMTMAIITPSCDPEWVAGLLSPMRRGVAPTAVLLDPNTFGGQGDVEALAGLLADFGIPSQRIVQGTPFQPVFEHERIGRPELKVLRGTGRVIVVGQEGAK